MNDDIDVWRVMVGIYQATRKDYDIGHYVGRGETPEAAIADLIEHEESEAEDA